MILEPKKIKSVTVSIVAPSVCHEVMGLLAMIIYLRYLQETKTGSVSIVTSILESKQEADCTCLNWSPHILPQKMLHPYGRKQRGTKEPLDASERGE